RTSWGLPKSHRQRPMGCSPRLDQTRSQNQAALRPAQQQTAQWLQAAVPAVMLLDKGAGRGAELLAQPRVAKQAVETRHPFVGGRGGEQGTTRLGRPTSQTHRGGAD